MQQNTPLTHGAPNKPAPASSLRRLALKAGLGVLAALVLWGSLGTGSTRAQASRYSPVGTWRLWWRGAVATSVFDANGEFMIQSYRGQILFTSWGRYEIRGNYLYLYYTGWSPVGMWNVDGSYTPIYMPRWESMWFQILDANRVRTQFGISYKIINRT
jgi:hypothetical protein